jgi:hypothetical protein
MFQLGTSCSFVSFTRRYPQLVGNNILDSLDPATLEKALFAFVLFGRFMDLPLLLRKSKSTKERTNRKPNDTFLPVSWGTDLILPELIQ